MHRMRSGLCNSSRSLRHVCVGRGGGGGACLGGCGCIIQPTSGLWEFRYAACPCDEGPLYQGVPAVCLLGWAGTNICHGGAAFQHDLPANGIRWEGLLLRQLRSMGARFHCELPLLHQDYRWMCGAPVCGVHCRGALPVTQRQSSMPAFIPFLPNTHSNGDGLAHTSSKM